MALNLPPPEADSASAFVDQRAEEAAFEELGAEVDAGRAPIDSRAEKRQARRERMRLLLRRPGFIIGTAILLFWIVCAIGGDRITPYDPIAGFDTPNTMPSADHWFGTDSLGLDVFSRVMAGARDVLIAAPITALISVSVGTLVGLLMGYYRGTVDEVLSRIVETLLSIPVILLALLVVVALGSSKVIVIGTVAILFIPIVARTVRAAVLAEAQLDYVTSARLRGESGLFVMTREILPNITGTIVVEFTVRIGYAVFTIATLAFLGAGVEAGSPDWGQTISANFQFIQSGQWWPTLFPALAIASLVIATNLVADSIDAVRAA